MLLPPLTRVPAYVLAWALAQAAVVLGAVATALACAAKRLASLTAQAAGCGSSSAHVWQPASDSCSVCTDGAVELGKDVSLATDAPSVLRPADLGAGAGQDETKAAFLQQAGSDYGYDGAVDALRRNGLARLRGRVYVDHAGAALYSEEQLRAATQVSLRACTSQEMPGYRRRLLVGWCSLGLGQVGWEGLAY